MDIIPKVMDTHYTMTSRICTPLYGEDYIIVHLWIRRHYNSIDSLQGCSAWILSRRKITLKELAAWGMHLNK